MTESEQLIIANECGDVSLYEPHVRTVFGALTAVSKEMGTTSDAPVTVVISDDLAESVRRRQDNPDFSVERIGGVVGGKTLTPQPANYDDVYVIVDVSRAASAASDSERIASFVYVLAHELMHVVIGRMRAATGDWPSGHRADPVEIAPLYALEAMDEWRCDVIADLVLGTYTAVVGPDGEKTPARHGLLNPQDWTAVLQENLDNVVHPGWPDLVHSYRIRAIPLEQMWEKLREQTSHFLKHIAHCEANASGIGADSPMNALSTHPGVDLYLGPVWEKISDVLRDQPLVSDLHEFQESQRQAMEVGGAVIVEMWERLGITGERTADGGVYLHVTDPVR